MEKASNIQHTEIKKGRNRLGIFLSELYYVNRFIGKFFKEAVTPPYEGKEIIRQCYEIGFRSLSIITLTAFVTGVVFTKQSRPSLESFGASSWLPSLIAIAIIRALAPLVTALVIAGKVGSNIGAELGSMKVTEQIDAMEVSSTNPFKFLVVTRVIACTITIPILVAYFEFIGLMGAFFNVHTNELTSFTTFIKDAFSTISFLDLGSSLVKGMIFGFTVGITGCYKGFSAQHGTVGVGRAANSSVVVAMFLVFIEEMMIVQVINYLR